MKRGNSTYLKNVIFYHIIVNPRYKTKI